MIQDENNRQHYIAGDGKVFRRKCDNVVVGNELFLGYTHYLGSIQLQTPLLELPEHYEEIDESQECCPEDKVTWNGDALFINGINIGEPPSRAYNDIKTTVVKFKYSNDDQIAIICNQESEDKLDKLKYQEMQRWRDFASIVAKKAIANINE